MADGDLANLSDQLMLGTVLLYVVAMVGYALDLGFGLRRRQTEQTEQAEQAAPAKVLVGSAGAEAVDAGTDAGDAADADADEGGRRRETDWGRFAVLINVLGWGAHLGMLVTRGWAAERWPWGNMYEFLSAIAFAAVTAYLVVLVRHKARFLGAFVMVAAVIALGIATIWLYTPVGPLVPALKSYWIAIHVSAAIVATGAFTVGGTATLLYLLQSRRQERGTEGGGALALLPGADTLDRLAYKITMFAFPIWTFAIIAGAIWADEAWGRYWGWDPKEVWSFVTWVIYAGYLHARATAGWRGRKAAIISLVAFAALLFNFFGVNYMFSGLHSYAG
ncbi:cytochrome c-type biogenesis protein CcsB [Thermomonospora echinospora]|uniref:Cytochrome c-type biogenesis protein CcsB n=1 Tax=Thermomonospora echinospora TaxID=1992 RepID=A0A1H5YZF1_9ACTN|nr:c-type cytochrome biogenesis protein CcsB [Thermomonospora echinospora]SEG29643.1 cytochrome c-type biogenesis protein CcsB [Thermomonospora echinospora]